ncbi:MAG: hypothetical protein LBN35_00575, partial [Clostridiales Family XIII bacterium]|nr:hypothetical protein [Clostridiales Family XIII bacterium]
MRRRLTYIVLILLLSLLFSGCSDTPAAFERGGAEPDTDYDFSVYLTGVGDPIRLNTLIEEYERKTGLDIEIITTQDGEASDRTLWRRLNAQEPPAVFTVDTQTDTARIAEAGIIKITDGDGTEGLEDIESAIPVRLKTMGFAADKKLLADLIAQEDSDRFISDLKAADYPEWNTFIITLGGYITEGTAADFKLNRHSYRFADKKSELTAGLTGVFAEPGADLSFIGRRLLDRTLATTDPVRWTDSSAELAAAAEAAAGATESVSGAGIAALTGAAFSAAAALTDNV